MSVTRDIKRIGDEFLTTANTAQLFDKVTVLYEGRQIFFGLAKDARSYFERLGFECPASQTTVRMGRLCTHVAMY